MRRKIEVHSISSCMGDEAFLDKILFLASDMTFENNRRACANKGDMEVMEIFWN